MAEPQVPLDRPIQQIPNDSVVPKVGDVATEREAIRAARIAALNSDNSEEKFNLIYHQLRNTGESQELNNTFEEELSKQEAEGRQQIEEILIEPLPLSEKQERIDQARRSSRSINLEDRAMRRVMNSNPIYSSAGRAQGVAISDNFEAIRESRKRSSQDAARILTFDSGAGDIAVDFAMAQAVPFTFGKQVVDVISSVRPNLVEPSDYVLTGDLIRRWRRELAGLPMEEQEAEIRQVLRAIEENDVFGIEGNGFIKWELTQALIERPFTDSLVDEVLDNFASALDIGLAGEIARLPGMAVRYGRQFKNLRKKRLLADQINDQMNLFENLDPASLPASLSDVAPETAIAVIQNAMEDGTGELAEALGTTRAQLVREFSAFRQPSDGLTTVPDVNDPVHRVANIDATHVLFSPDELSIIRSRNAEQLKAKALDQEYIQFNNMGVEAVPGGYRAHYRIQPTPENLFTNLSQANKVSNLYKGEYESSTVLARNIRDGGFVKVHDVDPDEADAVMGKVGSRQYLVDLEATHFLSTADAGVESGKRAGSATNKFAKFIDKSNSLTRWLINAGNTMGALSNQRRQDFNRVLLPLTRLKAKQRGAVLQAIDSQDRLERTLTDSELLALWDDANQVELLERFQAMRAFKEFQRQTWEVMNKTARREMNGRNLKRISFKNPIDKTGTTEAVGRVVDIDSVPPKIKTVWNPEAGTYMSTTHDELKTMLQNDSMQIILLDTPIQNGGHRIRYTLSEGTADDIPSNTPALTVSDLPAHVIPFREWYIPRIYDVTHILRKKIKMIDDEGNEFFDDMAIRMYPDRASAESDLDNMVWDEEPFLDIQDPEVRAKSDYYVARADETREGRDLANRTSLESLQHQGMLFFSPRGAEKKGFDGARQLVPVGDAITALRDRASTIGTTDLLVSKLIANWEARYGYLFEGIEETGMPLRGDGDILLRPKQETELLKDQDIKDAIALRDHIRLLAGVDETKLRQWTRNSMDWIQDTMVSSAPENTLGAKIRNPIARAAGRNRDVNLIGVPKMLNFVRYMVFQPLRQAMLQSSQSTIYLGVKGGTKYWMSLRGMRDMTAVTSWMLVKDLPGAQLDQFSKTLSKGLGMTEKEYKDLVETFENSGIFANVDSHQYAAELSEWMGGSLHAGRRISDDQIGQLVDAGISPGVGVVDTTRNVLSDINGTTQNILRFSRRIGFDLGEKAHRLPAFLTAKNRWEIDNPGLKWNDPENIGTIIGEAENLAANMNQQGTLEFQRNWMGMMAQFTSHAVKMSQAITPTNFRGHRIPLLDRFGNDTFSNREKGQILLWQMGLFGGGGLGINELVIEPLAAQYEEEYGESIPREVMDEIQEGLLGTAFNFMWKAVFENADEDGNDLNTGLESDIAFSESIAPLSAIVGGGHNISLNNPVGKLLDAIVFQNVDAIDTLLLGPSAQLGSDFKDAVEFTQLVKGRGTMVPPNTTAAEQIIQEWSSKIAPLYGKWLNSRAEFQINRLISMRSGNEIVQATDAELLANTYLGFKPRRNRQLGNLARQLQRSYGDPLTEGVGDELRNTARTFYEFAKTSLRRTEDGKLTTQDLIDLIDLNSSTLQLLLTEREKEIIFGIYIPGLIARDNPAVEQDTTGLSEEDIELLEEFLGDQPSTLGLEYEFTKKIATVFSRNDPDRFATTIQRIKNFSPFQGQDQLVQDLESMRQ